MLVRAYLRVSTEEQAEEGFSLPTQRQRVTDFCRSQWGPVVLITWYIDDGYSAKDTGRPQLSVLRKESQPGDSIVVLRLDRLTRSVLDLYTLLKEWEERGIFFRSVTEPYDTQKPEGRFMIGLLALLAEWERLRISERVREVMAHTVRADGRHLSKPPLGYDMCDGQLVINPGEAQRVREIFERACEGPGTRAIALELNRRNLKTRQGAAWSAFTIGYILRNPIYTGQVSWQGTPSQGTHQPLISAATWEAANALLSVRSRTPPRTKANQHPLTGILRCGLCGAPVAGVVQQRYRNGEKVPGRERRYYRCSRRDRLKVCTLPYLPATAIEQAVLTALDFPLGRLTEIAAALLPGQQADHRAELTKLNRALTRWDDAYEAGDLSREEWRKRRDAIRRRQDELQQSPHEATPETIASLTQNLPLIWQGLSPEERKTLLHGLLETVTAHPDGSVTLTAKLRPQQAPAPGDHPPPC